MGNQAARASSHRRSTRRSNSPHSDEREHSVAQEQAAPVDVPPDEPSTESIDVPPRPDTPRRMRPSLSARQLASYQDRTNQSSVTEGEAGQEEEAPSQRGAREPNSQAGAVHIEYVQEGSEMATFVQENSEESQKIKGQREPSDALVQGSDETRRLGALRQRRPSLMISDEELTAAPSAKHKPATGEPSGLEKFRISSADTARLDTARSSFIETHAEMTRQSSGGNARASLERLLRRSDSAMRDSVVHESQSRPSTSKIVARPRSRHTRVASVHDDPEISSRSSASSEEEEAWQQDARRRRISRARSRSIAQEQEGDTPIHSSNIGLRRQRGRTGEKSIRFGGEPMQRSKSAVQERGRVQISADALRLGERDRWRSESRARFEPQSSTSGTWSEYAHSSRSQAKGKSKVFSDDRSSSIRGEAFSVHNDSIQALIHEQAMQDLNAPSAYEQMPPDVRDQVHPIELEHELRPWPWNTQPEKLPAGVASSSSIESLRNIGWYCPGAERLARDLDDGTLESGEAVEDARNRWLRDLKLEALIREESAREKRRRAKAEAAERRRRHHSEAVTEAERLAQAKYLQEVHDDSLYETLYTRDGEPVRFPKRPERFEDDLSLMRLIALAFEEAVSANLLTHNKDDPNPLTSSVPIHFQLLDGQVEGARLLVRTRTVRQRPPTQSRNRSQGPPANSPRPRPRRSLHFSLDGAGNCEEELLFGFAEGLGIVVDLGRDDSRHHRRGSPLGVDGMSPSLSSNSQASTYSSPGVPSQSMVRQPPHSQNSMQHGQMQQQQQQQNAQHQANGIHGGANSAAALQASLGHTGHQPDFNYLWGIVQELTDALAQNRAQTASIVRGVQQIQARARQEGEEMPTAQQVNGELAHAAEVADLENRVHEMARDRDDMAAQHAESVHILADYERTMDSLMVKIREYANNHAKAIIGVHQHYETQLAAEREANLQLRIEHGQWQAGLGRAADLARKALRNRSEEMTGMEADLREAKTENRILRRIVGWEVEDSSDDDEGPDPSVGGSRFHDDAALRAVPSV